VYAKTESPQTSKTGRAAFVVSSQALVHPGAALEWAGHIYVGPVRTRRIC